MAEVIQLSFKKNRTSFGMFIIGGNRVGHYVHKVEPTSLASNIGIEPNDKLIKLKIHKNNQVMTIPFKKISHEEALLLLKALPINIELTIIVERNGKLPPYHRLQKSPDCFYIRATSEYRPPPKQTPIYTQRVPHLSDDSGNNHPESRFSSEQTNFRYSNPDRIYEKSSKNYYLRKNQAQPLPTTVTPKQIDRANSYSAGSNSDTTSDDQDKSTLNSECECDEQKQTSSKRNTIANALLTSKLTTSPSSAQNRHHLSSSDTGIECPDEDEWFYINKGDIFQVTHTHYKKSRKKWRAIKIFEPHKVENEKLVKMGSGVIPSGQNFYYERVCLRKPQFKRPIVIFSPFYEVVMKYLTKVRPNEFRILNGFESHETVEKSLANPAILSDIVRHSNKHSILTLNDVTTLEKFNKLTGLYPICVCIRAAFWENVEQVFKDSEQEFPNNVISRIEACMDLEYELDEQLITIDVDGSNVHAWKDRIISDVRKEQKKYVWITHDSLDIGMSVEEFRVMLREKFGEAANSYDYDKMADFRMKFRSMAGQLPQHLNC